MKVNLTLKQRMRVELALESKIFELEKLANDSETLNIALKEYKEILKIFNDSLE